MHKKFNQIESLGKTNRKLNGKKNPNKQRYQASKILVHHKNHLYSVGVVRNLITINIPPIMQDKGILLMFRKLLWLVRL